MLIKDEKENYSPTDINNALVRIYHIQVHNNML